MPHFDAARGFLDRARRGDVCFGIHLSSMSPQIVEQMGFLGLDFTIVSTEVESLDRRELEDLLRAAASGGTVPCVKLRSRDPELVGEAMNAGALLVMVPHVTSRDELDAAVRASRFLPYGTRGLCPVSRYTGFGALDMERARQEPNQIGSVIPIIEDREALANVDDMMRSDDVEVFEIGPWDLSQSLGVDPTRSYANPQTMEAVERIGELARRHDKALLAPLWVTPDCKSYDQIVQWNVEQLVPRGITMFYGIEVMVLARAFRSMMAIRQTPSASRDGRAPVALSGQGRSGT